MISLLAHAECDQCQTCGALSLRYGYGKSNITIEFGGRVLNVRGLGSVNTNRNRDPNSNPNPNNIQTLILTITHRDYTIP